MSQSHSPLTADLAKARGLGSAKDGTGHWWWQRVTAVLMLPLLGWFIYSFLCLMVGASRSSVAEWFAAPLNSIGLLVLLCAMFYHSKLGLQVVIEDYVQSTAQKLRCCFCLTSRHSCSQASARLPSLNCILWESNNYV